MIAWLVFGGSIAFVIYVLMGYPLLLQVLSRRMRPVRRSPYTPTVTVVVAVYNGEKHLESKLRSILSLDYPPDRLDTIVVSDGSTDATEDIARRFERERVRLISLPRGGKPRALNAAMAAVTGDVVVFTDVRQTIDPGAVRYLTENLADPDVGAVSGELVIHKGNSEEEVNTGLYWRYELWMRQALSRIDSIFGATGALYAVRRQLCVPIPPEALNDDMHLPLAAFFAGYRLVLDTRARIYDRAMKLDVEFRRKVRTLAGNYQILWAYPGLLGPTNRMWFHYVSYKFARLFLPFALLAVFFAALFLPEPWRMLAVAGQAVFYFLALCDAWLREGTFLKRITSPVRTFVVLMIATLCAIAVAFVPSHKLWVPTPEPQPEPSYGTAAAVRARGASQG